jgi:hypothetical protein
MLEWIWFLVLLAVMVGLIVWDAYYEWSDGDASMLRILIELFCFALCLYIKSDLLVEAPYDWLLNVLPEPNTAIHFITALFLTGCLVLAYLFGFVFGTYFLVERLTKHKKKGRA